MNAGTYNGRSRNQVTRTGNPAAPVRRTYSSISVSPRATVTMSVMSRNENGF